MQTKTLLYAFLLSRIYVLLAENISSDVELLLIFSFLIFMAIKNQKLALLQLLFFGFLYLLVGYIWYEFRLLLRVMQNTNSFDEILSRCAQTGGCNITEFGIGYREFFNWILCWPTDMFHVWVANVFQKHLTVIAEYIFINYTQLVIRTQVGGNIWRSFDTLSMTKEQNLFCHGENCLNN